MSEPGDPQARERLQALIGEWTMEAAPPGGPRWPGSARVVLEWLDAAPLVVERWHVDMPEAPDGTAVIGCDGPARRLSPALHGRTGCPAHLRHEPGGRRLEALAGWSAVRTAVHGALLRGRRTISGRWEIAEDGETWRTDFDLAYTKVR